LCGVSSRARDLTVRRPSHARYRGEPGPHPAAGRSGRSSGAPYFLWDDTTLETLCAQLRLASIEPSWTPTGSAACGLA